MRSGVGGEEWGTRQADGLAFPKSLEQNSIIRCHVIWEIQFPFFLWLSFILSILPQPHPTTCNISLNTTFAPPNSRVFSVRFLHVALNNYIYVGFAWLNPLGYHTNY